MQLNNQQYFDKNLLPAIGRKKNIIFLSFTNKRREYRYLYESILDVEKGYDLNKRSDVGNLTSNTLLFYLVSTIYNEKTLIISVMKDQSQS